MQCVATVMFLYFAIITPIVTFGGLLADATHNNIAAIGPGFFIVNLPFLWVYVLIHNYSNTLNKPIKRKHDWRYD